MRRKAAYLLTALMMLAAPAAYTAEGPEWVVVERSGGNDRELPAQQDAVEVEVKVKDGAVYITSATTVKVEVFTILGQLITTRRVPEGTVRLTLNQRGVYILKAGAITKRINL